MRELDTIVLTDEMPEQGLKAGDVGTIVLVHDEGTAYEVEFVALDEGTVAVVTLNASHVRSVAHGEIAHARLLTP